MTDINLKLAYAAGFFDGEGCVLISCCNGFWSPRLQVSQNDPRPLELFLDLFGGKIYKPAKSNNAYSWVVSGEASCKAAELILPYTMYKTEQLKIYVEVWRNNPASNNGKADDARDLAFALANVQIAALKRFIYNKAVMVEEDVEG